MTDKPKPYDRISLGSGIVLNRRTVAMVREVERRCGLPLRIFQGSYNGGGVAASGGTHDGGGALDCWPAPKGRRATRADRDRAVLMLRRVGFAAWFRPELFKGGVRIWGDHIHGISIDDVQASPSAKAQVVDYKNRRDGLAGHGPDTGPRVFIRPWALVRRVLAVKFATAELERWRQEH